VSPDTQLLDAARGNVRAPELPNDVVDADSDDDDDANDDVDADNDDDVASLVVSATCDALTALALSGSGSRRRLTNSG
jgi:hypothetical protein